MTCQNAADESHTGSTALDYVSLLSCSGIISRFGRQARLGERVDSGLTAYRHSEFATLDKIRLRYKTRLGRFITSPWRLAFLRLHHNNLTSHALFLGTDPVLRGAPKSVLKKLDYPGVLRGYSLNSIKSESDAEHSQACLASLKKGLILWREARMCAGEDKAYLRFMRRK